jgi:hypothetical protein
VFSLAPRSMGSRCSKKAVRCGASGVLVLVCVKGDFSPAGPGAASRRDFWVVPRHPPEHPGWVLDRFDRVFLRFPVRIRSASP